jgi:hypothetical protein
VIIKFDKDGDPVVNVEATKALRKERGKNKGS